MGTTAAAGELTQVAERVTALSWCRIGLLQVLALLPQPFIRLSLLPLHHLQHDFLYLHKLSGKSCFKAVLSQSELFPRVVYGDIQSSESELFGASGEMTEEVAVVLEFHAFEELVEGLLLDRYGELGILGPGFERGQSPSTSHIILLLSVHIYVTKSCCATVRQVPL